MRLVWGHLSSLSGCHPFPPVPTAPHSWCHQQTCWACTWSHCTWDPKCFISSNSATKGQGCTWSRAVPSASGLLLSRVREKWGKPPGARGGRKTLDLAWFSPLPALHGLMLRLFWQCLHTWRALQQPATWHSLASLPLCSSPRCLAPHLHACVLEKSHMVQPRVAAQLGLHPVALLCTACGLEETTSCSPALPPPPRHLELLLQQCCYFQPGRWPSPFHLIGIFPTAFPSYFPSALVQSNNPNFLALCHPSAFIYSKRTIWALAQLLPTSR